MKYQNEAKHQNFRHVVRAMSQLEETNSHFFTYFPTFPDQDLNKLVGHRFHGPKIEILTSIS